MAVIALYTEGIIGCYRPHRRDNCFVGNLPKMLNGSMTLGARGKSIKYSEDFLVMGYFIEHSVSGEFLSPLIMIYTLEGCPCQLIYRGKQ